MSDVSEQLLEQVSQVRADFIEETYPIYFPTEEMGEATREIAPSELTAILHVYEYYLAKNGLLQVIKESQEEI